MAVEYPAPAWRDQRQVDPVAFGLERVFRVLGYGQIAETAGQEHTDAELHAADDDRSPVETVAQRHRAGEAFLEQRAAE